MKSAKKHVDPYLKSTSTDYCTSIQKRVHMREGFWQPSPPKQGLEADYFTSDDSDVGGGVAEQRTHETLA